MSTSPPTISYLTPQGYRITPPPAALFWISVVMSIIALAGGLISFLGYALSKEEGFAVFGLVWLYAGGFLTFIAGILSLVYVGIAISRRFTAPGSIRRSIIAILFPGLNVVFAVIFTVVGLGMLLEPLATNTTHSGYSTVLLNLKNTSDTPIESVVAIDGDRRVPLGPVPANGVAVPSITFGPDEAHVDTRLEITRGGQTWTQPALDHTVVHTSNGASFDIDLAPPATQPATQPTTAPTAEQIRHLAMLGKREIGAHDPSTIVRDGDWYYCFVTGQGIPVIRSRDLQTWTAQPHVFKRSPDWVATAVPENRGHFWAPDLVRAKDGRWLLYYSVSSFGKQTSTISLATNKTLDPSSQDYAWKDEGIVVKSSPADRFNAIDPAVLFDADGRLWMVFGSYWDGIKLIELDPATGMRKDDDAPIGLARNHQIEAAFIYHHGDHYYLFVNWGSCCQGVKSNYEIRIGRSDKITGPYLDRDGKDLANNGGTQFLATGGLMIGPGHAGIVTDAGGHEQVSFHFYDGSDGGKPKLGIRPLTWDAEGWPVSQDRQ